MVHGMEGEKCKEDSECNSNDLRCDFYYCCKKPDYKLKKNGRNIIKCKRCSENINNGSYMYVRIKYDYENGKRVINKKLSEYHHIYCFSPKRDDDIKDCPNNTILNYLLTEIKKLQKDFIQKYETIILYKLWNIKQKNLNNSEKILLSFIERNLYHTKEKDIQQIIKWKESVIIKFMNCKKTPGVPTIYHKKKQEYNRIINAYDFSIFKDRINQLPLLPLLPLLPFTMDDLPTLIGSTTASTGNTTPLSILSPLSNNTDDIWASSSGSSGSSYEWPDGLPI